MDHLSDEAQQCLRHRIQNLQWRGILGNWGYAVPVTFSSVTTASDMSSDDVLPSDGLPTSPIEAESVIKCNNLVPTRKIGSQDAPSLVAILDLTANDDITLLMGADNPDDDSCQTIDLCPLYWTVSSIDFVQVVQADV
jgi:hypothetical protein